MPVHAQGFRLAYLFAPLILLVLPSALLAETLSIPKPIFFEDKTDHLKPVEFVKNSSNSTADTPIFMSIEQAILYRYAKGAMLRAEQDYDGAIELYQQILQTQPQLAYPRFDLGVMLFENKQYREAKQQLNKARKSLDPQMQPLVERYLQAMAERQNWQPDAELQYTQTDNVNNASSEREVEIGGLRLLKNEDYLPQKAHGFRYGLGASREINLSGNHFVAFEGRFSGVHYWDNQDYSEKSLYGSFGYRKHSALQSWGILPFFEQNWLASPRYSKNFGANAEFRRQLNRQWTFSTNFNHTQKRYADENIA